MMGRDDVDDKSPSSTWGDEFPAHTETVGSFLMDVYETTNAQYAQFLKASGRKAPSYWVGDKFPDGQDNFPVTNVTLSDAKAYAAWISSSEGKKCRVPEEKEWEYAARNGSQLTAYPWGNDWRPDAARLKGRDAVAVGTSGDVTLTGVKDMLGNVSEWTVTRYATYKGHPQPAKSDLIVFRGLNFGTKEVLFSKPERLVTYRQGDTEDSSFDSLGFRLVCDK
jgi:formylglycine-generating enzyme required for sulfatase activity